MPKRKGAKLLEEQSTARELRELREELERVSAGKEKAEHELGITREEIARTGAVEAAQNTMLRTWPGIDWKIPAWYVQLAVRGSDGEAPANGRIGFGDSWLIFKDGWTVTNELELARSVIRHAGGPYAIGEVKGE